MRMSAALCAACVLCLAALAGIALGQDPQPEPSGKAKGVNNGECLAALEIWGEWKPNKDVTEMIAGNTEDATVCTFEKFDEKDTETPKLLLSEADKFLSQMRSRGGRANETDAFERAISEIYAMGKYTRTNGDRKVEQRFMLVNFMGNPHLFILRVTNSGRLDWETQNLAFARDPKGNGDLLFLGGDHKNERFTCLVRTDK